MIAEIAPAKINLYLHVGPVRMDGLHALESLFVFAAAGDRIEVAPARDLSLSVVGPFASALAGTSAEHNIVMRAARALGAASGAAKGARITLEKNLPVAAGVGGGSADAAAALRALMRLWEVSIPAADLHAIAFRLGADVPACLAGRPLCVSGAGEILRPGPSLPPLFVCLVNPRRPMPTGPVFRAFDAANPRPPFPEPIAAARVAGFGAVGRLMSQTRNDLEPFAAAREPAISDVVDFLAATNGCIASRMSGSGATCFGLFASASAAARAARSAAARGWWAESAAVLR